MRIAVIGGGAAAVSLVDSVLRTFDDTGPSVGITVYEPSTLATGRAYRDDLDCALVNRQMGFMSVRRDERDHFVGWLRQNERYRDTPYANASPESFIPRRVFGEYLKDHFSTCADQARLRGWQVRVRGEAVVDLATTGQEVLVRSASGVETFDTAALCVGTGEPADPYRLNGAPGFHADPYPLADFLPQVPSDSHVLVLGTGLSGVDVALGLLHLGHRGPITMASRRGVLPGVRVPQRSRELVELSCANIDRHVSAHGRLRLTDLWYLLRRELRAAGVDDARETASLRGGVAAAEYLRHQLNLVDGNPLQEIMMSALHQVKIKAWRSLCDQDRHRLVQRYNTRLKSIYNPMPPQSARTLLAALDSGQLRVIRRLVRVAARPGAGFELATTTGAGRADVVINTCRTGLSQASSRAQPLLDRLVASEHAAWHPFGGLRVDPATGALLRPSGEVHSGIRAIGEVTSGEVYYASSLFAVNSGADVVARDWSAQHARRSART